MRVDGEVENRSTSTGRLGPPRSLCKMAAAGGYAPCGAIASDYSGFPFWCFCHLMLALGNGALPNSRSTTHMFESHQLIEAKR